MPVAGSALRFARCIHAGFMKGHAKLGGKFCDEGEIGVGLLAAQAVMQMGRVQHQAQFRLSRGKRAQQGDRVRACRRLRRQGAGRA